jgi:hypothetical protein
MARKNRYFYWHNDNLVSRQRMWQIRKREAGKCIICGKMREKYACYCDKCAMVRRLELKKKGRANKN